MEKFEGDFLKDKYWTNKDFRGATEASAHRTEVREGITTPNTPQERIENYIDRFSEITDREDPKKRIHGIAAIERLVEKKYIIKPEKISDDYIKNVLLGNEAELLGYERDETKNEDTKKIVLSSLEKKLHSTLNEYTVPAEVRRSLETMTVTDQKVRMKQWLDYLTGEEAVHAPTTLRYWAFAEMLKQGDYDPVRKNYNKRTDTTVAIFPELDQQALALVFDEIERRRTGKSSAISGTSDTHQAELSALLTNENFGSLYSFMQEHVRSLKLPAERMIVTEGEWKVFKKGSAATELTAPLQAFQTKWCIAGEGHAANYLNTGDVWIYFSQDVDGDNTIPRACIIDNEDRGITEVRGIIFNGEVKQHLDDYITPVVDAKLKTMKRGEEWSDKMEDMKRLGELHFKHLQKQSFTKDDLTFLYEIDHPIQSSGYGTDPRIAELREGRNVEEDMLVIFDATRDEITHVPSQISEKTKAYVGPLEPGIFQRLPENLEHVYTSFPDKKIRREKVQIRGKSGEQLISEMEAVGIFVSENFKSILKKAENSLNTNPNEVTLIRLTVADFGFKSIATTEQIFNRAQSLGLELCSTNAALAYHLKHRNEPSNEWTRSGLEDIIESDDRPCLLCVDRDCDGLWLNVYRPTPPVAWGQEYMFVFCLHKTKA